MPSREFWSERSGTSSGRSRYSSLLGRSDGAADTHIPNILPRITVVRWVERFFPEKTPDVIVYGDTHTQLINEIDGILCVNPGSPTYPNQYKVQYGTIGFLELEAGQTRPSVWLITDHGIEPFDWSAAI